LQWMPNAPLRPHRCAVIPFIGSSTTKKGFIDTKQDLGHRDAKDHVYISVEAVEQMAAMVGWIPKNALAVAETRLKTRDDRIAELEAELAEAKRFREAAEYTLNQFGAQVRNKPGRKPRAVA
jgi:hypothetical protein